MEKCDKLNSHTNVHGTFVPKNFTVAHFTSLKKNHLTKITSVHSTSLHLFTLNPNINSLACNYILNLLSKRV
jgi:hypothetical protein